MKLGIDAGGVYVKVAEAGTAGPRLTERLCAGELFSGARPSHVVVVATDGAHERARRAGFDAFTTISPPRAALVQLLRAGRLDPPGRILLCDVGAFSIDLYLCLLGSSVIYVLNSSHSTSSDLGGDFDRMSNVATDERASDNMSPTDRKRLQDLLDQRSHDTGYDDTPAWHNLTIGQMWAQINLVADRATQALTRMRLDDFGSRPDDLLVLLGGGNLFSPVRDAVRDALSLAGDAMLALPEDELINTAAYGAARIAAGQHGYDHYPLRLSLAAHRIEGAQLRGEWLDLAAPGEIFLGGEPVYASQSIRVEEGHELVVAIGDPGAGRHLSGGTVPTRGDYLTGVRVAENGHADLIFDPATPQSQSSTVSLGTLPTSW